MKGWNILINFLLSIIRSDLHISQAPSSIKYKTLETIEHNICDVLANRVKRGKGSWSNKGANNMVKILAEKFNNRTSNIIDSVCKNITSDKLLKQLEKIVNLYVSSVNES